MYDVMTYSSSYKADRQSYSGLVKFWFIVCFIPEDYNQVFYLGFDRYNGDRLYDDSQHNNNATLKSAVLDKVPGSCGMCLKVCCGGGVVIDGAKFSGKLVLSTLSVLKTFRKTRSNVRYK